MNEKLFIIISSSYNNQLIVIYLIRKKNCIKYCLSISNYNICGVQFWVSTVRSSPKFWRKFWCRNYWLRMNEGGIENFVEKYYYVWPWDFCKLLFLFCRWSSYNNYETRYANWYKKQIMPCHKWKKYNLPIKKPISLVVKQVF